MGKSPFVMGKSTISMVIFHSYVKLPEGREFNVKKEQVKVTQAFHENEKGEVVSTRPKSNLLLMAGLMITAATLYSLYKTRGNKTLTLKAFFTRFQTWGEGSGGMSYDIWGPGLSEVFLNRLCIASSTVKLVRPPLRKAASVTAEYSGSNCIGRDSTYAAGHTMYSHPRGWFGARIPNSRYFILILLSYIPPQNGFVWK